jgi:CDGSH-type Zn-finger protein
MKKAKIVISINGPYIVTGGLPLDTDISVLDEAGEPDKWVKGRKYPVRDEYNLCRCGNSKNKPFCDGSHEASNFDGSEKTGRRPYNEESETIEGPGVDVSNGHSLCARARFCHPKGGIGKLIRNSNDPDSKKSAIYEANNCPAGKLVAYDKKTGKPIENIYEPSLSLTEDPQKKASGPVWVKGGVEIESGYGKTYEIRNRVTLCRCGGSGNKPFCDGSHIDIGFNDGDESLKK